MAPDSAALTPAERMRNAAYKLRKGAPIPTDCVHLPSSLAAVLEQEALWAEERGSRYPDQAPVLALADSVRAGDSDD